MKRAAVMVAVALLSAGCAAAPAASSSGSAGREVVYRVGGTAARADMTFSTTSDGANITQENGRRVPWVRTFTAKKSFLQVYTLTAQNRGGGTVTCSVTIDGKRVASNKATGRYAVVSCNAN